jgi:hypothetical protein
MLLKDMVQKRAGSLLEGLRASSVERLVGDLYASVAPGYWDGIFQYSSVECEGCIYTLLGWFFRNNPATASCLTTESRDH